MFILNVLYGCLASLVGAASRPYVDWQYRYETDVA